MRFVALQVELTSQQVTVQMMAMPKKLTLQSLWDGVDHEKHLRKNAGATPNEKNKLLDSMGVG